MPRIPTSISHAVRSFQNFGRTCERKLLSYFGVNSPNEGVRRQKLDHEAQQNQLLDNFTSYVRSTPEAPRPSVVEMKPVQEMKPAQEMKLRQDDVALTPVTFHQKLKSLEPHFESNTMTADDMVQEYSSLLTAMSAGRRCETRTMRFRNAVIDSYSTTYYEVFNSKSSSLPNHYNVIAEKAFLINSNIDIFYKLTLTILGNTECREKLSPADIHNIELLEGYFESLLSFQGMAAEIKRLRTATYDAR